MNLIRKLQAERDRFFAEIKELQKIIDAMRASENMSAEDTPSEVADIKEAAIGEVVDFQAVRLSTNYITHYVAHHRDFSSLVIVVLWKSEFPGPAICHDDKPLLYVHQSSSTEEAFDAWSDLRLDNSPSSRREYTVSELQDAVRVKQVIAKHQKRLFAQHSNLVAIRSSDHVNGSFYIEFVVLCKRFVPIADKESLPRHLEDIPTRVCSGWIQLCGRREQTFHRPLLPGAGFAAGDDAELLLNVDQENYVPPVLGTLGGYYVANGVWYGVTCAHCIRKHGQATMHSQDTPVFQPSAMGLVLMAASIVPEYLDAYDTLKISKGYHGAMKWLVDELGENFTTELPVDSQCGMVHGGVFGPLNNDGLVVDVALVKLAVDVVPHCTASFKFPGLQSPSLILGDETATAILEREDFPRHVFSVFGRGARSIDTMQALVNPFQSDIYFRPVQQDGVENLVFNCIHAITKKNWQPGDSGTWCWTEDGLLVGMGMAYAHIEREHYCCIMPMSHVLAAIEQLI